MQKNKTTSKPKPRLVGPTKYKKLVDKLAKEALDKLFEANPNCIYGIGTTGLAEDMCEMMLWHVDPENYVPSCKAYEQT